MWPWDLSVKRAASESRLFAITSPFCSADLKKNMLGINADYVNRRIEELRQTLSESGGDRP